MNCPNCGSEDTVRLAVAYAQGTNEISTTGRGFGIGPNAIVGGLVYTSGQSQSVLATVCAPPPKKPTERPAQFFALGLLPAGLAFILPFMFRGTSGLSIENMMIALMAAAFFSPIWGPALYLSIKRERYNKEIWPSLYEQWLKQWFCRKCGAICTAHDH